MEASELLSRAQLLSPCGTGLFCYHVSSQRVESSRGVRVGVDLKGVLERMTVRPTPSPLGTAFHSNLQQRITSAPLRSLPRSLQCPDIIL